MSEDPETAAVDEASLAPDGLRDEEGHINIEWLDRLRASVAKGESATAIEMMAPLHAADAGDVLEALEADERLALVNLLGDDFDFSALTEVDETVRAEIIEQIPNEDIARGVAGLDSDDAV